MFKSDFVATDLKTFWAKFKLKFNESLKIIGEGEISQKSMMYDFFKFIRSLSRSYRFWLSNQRRKVALLHSKNEDVCES